MVISMSPQVDVPVLIVGGGIVGLTASLCLSYHGIHHLLVERHVGTSIHPRARGFNIRAMEIFRELGVDQLVRHAGAELSSSKGIYRGASLAEVLEPMKRSAAHSSSGMPFSSQVKRFSPTVGAWATQDFVEPALLKVARDSTFADLRFYTECTNLTQSESEVVAEIRNRETDDTSSVHAQYVIAADGAKSPIRQRLGIETTGKGKLGNLINILFEADLRELVRGREFSLCVVDRPEVRGLFASLNNRDRWVFQLAYKPDKGERAEDYPIERCRELIQLALGMPKVDIKITGALPWEPSVRVARKLREGRVFFAGDAAHQMPPWRGQGATTGISDVHNLTWKLAAVLNKEATPAVLDTYNSERLPVGRIAADMSGTAAGEDGLIEWNWKVMLSIIFSLPWMTGLGYNYESSAIIPDRDSPYFGIPWYPTAWVLDLQGRPGTRVPHLAVRQGDQDISTLDVCYKTFTILAGQHNIESWRQATKGVQESMGVKLKVYSVGSEGDLRDAKDQWTYLARITSGGALLVRPDGFVAWRSYSQPEDTAKRLEQVMRQILCR